ncbi:hypothetical protein W97_05299 [Coniosporium apollinis CBS 100218]|uniref:Protein ROT1 n=1 Tax=Coniosporium apollinis (strain CBS 100218) TaxID=1168221 RepID=R7YWM4_CONA1|nr:uncharacterized protein W97_05299 [Coniosporium apollinis CBS 100218]EON66056.1 hypothetical protein W97_05299 [Coniosporium apollinis CBS 100218]
MLSAVASVLLAGLSVVAAQLTDPRIVGTWSSKSNSTFTGPGFYDPVNEKFTEPQHPGISYSFTEDGYFESAYFRAIANPQQPQCPKGIIQWQHGRYTLAANGRLTLTPFGVDGRQLFSDPCIHPNAILTRYSQSEEFERYEPVASDPYHNIPRLNLFRFDGSPVMPLYLVYRPPQMLPTKTLNPTGVSATATSKSQKFKRSKGLDETELPLNHRVLSKREELRHATADRWWWFGVAATGVGGVLYFCF